MKYTTPFVALVGPASVTIQGTENPFNDKIGLVESILPSNLEED